MNDGKEKPLQGLGLNDRKEKSPSGDLGVKHFRIKITGKVQGVFFRASTKAVADQMGVKGLVKNEKDGSVYVEAEATEIILEMFVDWCNEGPEKAKVENVELSEDELKNYRNFDVVKKNLLW